METFKRGKLVKSKAGHDIGRLYVIIDVDDAYVYLADGRIRTLDKLKKKKKKHVQIINQEFDITNADDVSIRQLIKSWNREEEK